MPPHEVIDGVPVRHERISGDGVELHVAVAGGGQPVLLLHGFPENWRSWRKQIAPLVRAGFAAWVPDLRGYSDSERPRVRAAYHMDHLVADVAALARATSHARVHVVGHDWGGVIAWAVAERHPDLIDRLVIANAPHPRLYRQQLLRPSQFFRSWYVLFFQLPRLPELALAARDFAAIRDMFERMPARRGAFTTGDIDEYVRALAEPGALTAALDYYRANMLRGRTSRGRSLVIGAPTLVIWGERDPALTVGLLDGLERVAANLHVRRFPDLGHWIQNEAPDEFNRELLRFFGLSPLPGTGVGVRNEDRC